MKNQTFAGGTLYHIYLSTLKSYKHKTSGVETLLVYNDKTPNIEQIVALLRKHNVFNYYVSIPTAAIARKRKKEQSLLKRRFLKKRLAIKYVEENSEILKFQDFINKSEINLFFNHGLLSAYFIIKYKKTYIRLLEDGYRNYNHRTSKFKAFKRKYISHTVIGEGLDASVKSIEVQFPEKLPKSKRNKGTKLDLDLLQKSISKNEKNSIISIFLRDYKINIESGKNFLLLTQPLSEDKIISEEKKIALYQEILDTYARDYNVYIKVHPRELTNYKDKLTTEYKEISKDFPIELLNFFNNIKFDLGVTIFSSAIFNLNCIENKVFLGEEYI